MTTLIIKIEDVKFSNKFKSDLDKFLQSYGDKVIKSYENGEGVLPISFEDIQNLPEIVRDSLIPIYTNFIKTQCYLNEVIDNKEVIV